MVILFAFALATIRLRSSALKRTGTMRPLASPFGSLGRPTFLGLGWVKGSKLLCDGYSDCCFWRDCRRDLEDRNVSLGLLGIVRSVCPGIRMAGLCVAV